MNLHQPHGSVFPLAYTSNPLIEILQMLQELWRVLSWLLAAITSFYSQLFRRPREEQRIPALPVEVCEPTTDFINISFVRFSSASDKARRDTLLACALTCRAWRVRSQIHLYNSLILDAKTQLQSCISSFQDNPALGPSVRSLTLCGNRTGDQFPSGVEHWTSLVALPSVPFPGLARPQMARLEMPPSWFLGHAVHHTSHPRPRRAQVVEGTRLSVLRFSRHHFARVMDVHCVVVHPHSSM